MSPRWLKSRRPSPPEAAEAERPEPAMPPQAGPTFAADQPIASKDEDRLSRWPFAHRIAQTIAARTDPHSLVVGIYGVWGDGKTSVLRMMQAALKDDPQMVCVEFNPWYFEREPDLLRGFFATLAEALGRTLHRRHEKLAELLAEYGGLLELASISSEGVRILGRGLSTVTWTNRAGVSSESWATK
jgi:KAP family P-loop domain